MTVDPRVFPNFTDEVEEGCFGEHTGLLKPTKLTSTNTAGAHMSATHVRCTAIGLFCAQLARRRRWLFLLLSPTIYDCCLIVAKVPTSLRVLLWEKGCAHCNYGTIAPSVVLARSGRRVS
jgi:hypothetical protein